MTTVTSFQSADKDLSRPDDHMDLAPSPARPSDDVDFDLEDARGVSADSNQDILLEDDPERPTAASDPVQSVPSGDVDDDPMVDEDVTPDLQTQRHIPELNMDDQQQDLVREEEEDDIIYDEEEVEEQETKPLDNSGTTLAHVQPDQEHLHQDQIPKPYDTLEDEYHVEAEIDFRTDGAAHASEANAYAEAQFDNNSGILAEAGNIDMALNPGADTNGVLKQDSYPTAQDTSFDHQTYPHDQNEGAEHVNLEVDKAKTAEVEENVTTDHTTSEHDLQDGESPPRLEGAASVPPLSSTDNDNHLDEEKAGDSAPGYAPHHIVKVHYLDTEMYLFPPMEEDAVSEMFFLQDVGLAHEGLDKMLSACRDVLADTIGDDDELVLDVASLGLHISEGSRYASEISLSQILDVYTNLAHNNDFDSIEPLSCTLSSRVCLASQYAYLQSAATEGKTLSQVSEEIAFISDGSEEHVPGFVDASLYENEAQADVRHPAEPRGHETEQEATTEQLDDTNLEDIGVGGKAQTKSPTDRNDQTLRSEERMLRDVASRHEQQSPTSTIKGDLNEPEDGDLALEGLAHHDDDEGPTHEKRGDSNEEWNGSHSTNADVAKELETPPRQDLEDDKEVSVKLQSNEGESDLVEEDLFPQDRLEDMGDNRTALVGSQSAGEEEVDLNDDVQSEQGPGNEGKISLGEFGASDIRHPSNTDIVAPNPSSPVSNDVSTKGKHQELGAAVIDTKSDDGLLDLEEGQELEAEEEQGEEKQESFSPTHMAEEHYADPAAVEVTQDKMPKLYDTTPQQYDEVIDNLGNDPPAKAKDPDSPILTSDKRSATPHSGQISSKRKLSDDEDIDLFDLSTPESKRRRS